MNNYDFYVTPEEYKTAEKNGITHQRVDVRIRAQGWEKLKAITTPPRHKNERDKWLKVALTNGICETTFYGRVNKSKWTMEKAATTPLQKPSGRELKYNEEIQNKLKENNITRQTFYMRIKRGWSIERACTEKTLTPKEILDNLTKINKTNGNYFNQLQAYRYKRYERREMV